MLTDAALALPEEHWLDRPLTVVGRALDEAALRGMCLAFDASIALEPDELQRVRASMAPYVTPELQRDPRRFFAFLDRPEPPRLLTSMRRRSIAGGSIVGRRFASGYERFAPAADDDAATCRENALIPVEHWMHDEQPAATVVAVHGFTMGEPRFDAFVLMAAKWFKLGLDVALVTLPFHGARCPRTARYSGELFGSWDVGRLNESVRQSVHDVDIVMRWIASESDAPVGMIGLSLGGYVTSLVASLRSTLAFVLPVVPAVSLASLPSQLFALSRHRHAGPPLAREQLEAAYHVHSPLTYSLAVPQERVLIIAARGDRIVPPEHPHALWKHWGEPAMHWYSGSHFAPFRRPDILAAGQRHLEQLGIL